jgi:hypothetical protein
MSDLERLGVVAGICICVVVLAWLARRAALDVDAGGGPGWLVGFLVLAVPPLGLAAWAVLHGSIAEHPSTRGSPPER